jgi:RHS repeat-associated protein
LKLEYLSNVKVEHQAYTNGVTTSFGYDGRGMISSVRHKQNASGRDLAYRQYWRDDRDRIKAWKRGTDSTLNGMEDGRGDRYAYDNEGQLTLADYRVLNPETTPSGALRGDRFTYDELGSRWGWNNVASRGRMLHRRRDNGLNQYFSWENDIPAGTLGHWGSAVYYDDNFQYPSPPWIPPGNGVTMADGWIVASYNALNQPVAMGSFVYWGTPNWVWFGYDPLGRCVKRWVNPSGAATTNPATYLYYDGWNLVQEGASAFSAQRAYIHGGRVDEIVASVNYGTGQLAYHHYDARGHCALLTDTNANILEQYDYDAFGFPYFYGRWGNNLRSYDPHSQSWLGNSPYGNRFLFTGREWFADLKLYDYRARMYQPELGRFLQPDPKQFAAGDYNLYRYCHNDPVNNSDPTGEFGWPGAAWGAVAATATEVLFQGTENMINDKTFFSSMDYSKIGISAGLGAATGGLGYGVPVQTGKAVRAGMKWNHIRQVLAARRAAQEAGKVRNLVKTEQMQKALTAEAKAAAAAAARGASGPLIKRGAEELVKDGQAPIPGPDEEKNKK